MIREEINREIEQMFREWDASDIAEIEETIGEAVADDVMCSSDYPNHNTSDIRIAIKRVIIERIKGE
jgi:deferrochelatase/peroxidase EfeB